MIERMLPSILGFSIALTLHLLLFFSLKLIWLSPPESLPLPPIQVDVELPAPRLLSTSTLTFHEIDSAPPPSLPKTQPPHFTSPFPEVEPDFALLESRVLRLPSD